MPSLRQRVSTYFRQLSFINEPNHRDGDGRFHSSLSPRNTPNHGCFIKKYLEAQLLGNIDTESKLTEIIHGKEADELPDLHIDRYDIGSDTILAACTGPDEGLRAIRRSRTHLSLGDDIDFIDTANEETEIRKSEPKPKEFAYRYRYQQQLRKKFFESMNPQYVADQNANQKPIVEPTRPRKLSKSDAHEQIAKEQTVQINQLKTEQTKSGSVNIIVRTIRTTINDNDLAKENIIPNDNSTNDNNVNSTSTINCTSPDEFAGVSNWNRENDNAFGVSVSLYEMNQITGESTGNPIADCYGLVMRGNSIAMALSDGVNWGEGAKLAARSAIQGSLDYLDKAVFGQITGNMAKSTREIFVSLLRSFSTAQQTILDSGGALTTLTVAVILPLSDPRYSGKSVVCCCNVGDSLGYVYSQTHGVREITCGSHDVNSMRDMRDALGALGPVDGNKPELSNLTLSMTIVEPGDIVFLTSDGISDNFDPVVGKFADPLDTNPQSPVQSPPPQQSSRNNFPIAPKRQNKSTSAVALQDPKRSSNNHPLQKSDTQPIQTARQSKKAMLTKAVTVASETNTNGSHGTTSNGMRPKFLRSHTVIEPRMRSRKSTTPKLAISANGLPLVTATQRHALTLLRMEDLLSFGINGTLQQNISARKLCNLLIDFVTMITSAKRKMLEQREVFYKYVTAVSPPDPITGKSGGVVKKEVQLNRMQHRAARKRVIDGPTFSLLPGKLDHATIVAVKIPMMKIDYYRSL